MKARWGPWVSSGALALLTVVVGVATNQIQPTAPDATTALWAAGAVVAAAATGLITHKTARPAQPEPHLWEGLTGPRGRPRLLTEVTPRALGAHPSRYADEGEGPYLARAADAALASALADETRRTVLVCGPRLAGTTRTLAQAARSALGQWRVAAFVDDPSVPLADMITAAAEHVDRDHGVVLWLERLTPERFVELAQAVARDLPTGVRILATLDSAVLEGARVPEPARMQIEDHAHRIDVGALTGSELRDVAEADLYADLRPVLEAEDDVLLGRLLVSWTQIRDALSDQGEQATSRIALVRAVTDWQRISPPRRLNTIVLDYLYRAYRNHLAGRPPNSPVSASDFRAALKWARTSEAAHRPRLVDEYKDASGAFYTAHPLLAALAEDAEEPAAWAVADPLWRYADMYFDGDQRRDLGYTALRLGAYPAARRLLNHTDTEIDPAALTRIAQWLATEGNVEAAHIWLRRVISTEHPDEAPRAMVGLGVLEYEQGNTETARTWLRRVITTQHPDEAPRAMSNLGILEEQQGNTGAARTWYHHAITTQHPDHTPRAMYNLGVLEKQQGNTETARTWYHHAITTQHPDHTPRAMYNLGVLEKQQGNTETARTWYHHAITTEHPEEAPSAMVGLGVLEYEQGNTETAHTWLRRVITTEHPDEAPRAMSNLGILEYEQGNTETAHTWYHHAITTQHPDHTPRAESLLRELEEGVAERRSAEHFARYGWQAYADPALLRRREPVRDSGADSAQDEDEPDTSG
ncbi:Flp pilus assembly protein TadD [Lipingzhangella halophila]|uniref:Flp pilus assembly protein TadD n=1 Tax=Lipingzhangella halophila TaxID=1783352 RepID=A0A7W7W128_9ACTN|nr:tetratricopeptide repeat protein [Lipingzhangella halophila]MBB4930522.1 Flp pilus assembly protein TadD [Lipingzhangella halophila]